MVRSGSVWLSTGLVAADFLNVCRIKSNTFLTNLYGAGSFRIVSLNTQILRKEPKQITHKIRLKGVQNIFVCRNTEMINQ